jgi:hypothetical protein
MIKGLMAGPGLNVNGGNTSVPYVNQNISNPMQGMLRLSGSDMQVFDGNNWITMSTSYATVELNGESQAILKWARDQRELELGRAKLIENNPALQNAYKAILRAEQNFDILAKFVESDPITSSSMANPYGAP